MAKRAAHGGRSRKRRSGGSGSARQTARRLEEELGEHELEREAAAPQRRGAARREQSAQTQIAITPTAGERPQAPWHPLPLSEILIFVGAIAAVIGFRAGEGGKAALLAGIGAAAVGTLEVTLREHLSGYRSHTIMLALIPVLMFHTAVVLVVAAFTTVPRLLNAGLLLIDAPLFALLFRLLRSRFLDARRERSFGGAGG